MTEANTQRAERLEAAHDDLVTAVESLVSGDNWAAMLATASHFHRYSANNVFLIMLQRPDATRVAGYRAWQALGRQVRKGEKGILILAPCKFRRTWTDEESGEELSMTGIRGFTTTHVFDISQTDGEEIPDVLPELLAGEAPEGAWESLAQLVIEAGFELATCWSEQASIELLGTANGQTNYADHTVTIRHGLSDAQRVKTLTHELAHVILHEGELFECRGVKEVEAESVAHLVCQAFGMSTDVYTFPYVARWADGDADVVRSTADRVIKTSHAILSVLEPEGIVAESVQS
jgi:antirestriction protein ArdC